MEGSPPSPSGAAGEASSSTSYVAQQPAKVESTGVKRLNFEETQKLTNSIISFLQISGPMTLDSIAASVDVQKVHAARILDILSTTPIVSIVREEENEEDTRCLYKYCEGKKLPMPVSLKTLRTDISEEMKGISETHESVSQLRSILSRPSKGLKDDMALKALLENILDKEKINSIDNVNINDS